MPQKLEELSIVKGFKQGKVRELYDLGDTMLIVTSDRISAFDVVFDDLIPDKGKILNLIYAHFFKSTTDIVPNHFISDDIADYPKELHPFEATQGRSMLVKRPASSFECIVRGYISGLPGRISPQQHSWRNDDGEELQESQKFPKPLSHLPPKPNRARY